MKKTIYNAIERQTKTETSRITPKEWNQIINVLKDQANFNADVLEKLFKDLGYMDKDIKTKIAQVEAGLLDWDKILEEIKNSQEVHVGRRSPEGNEKIWFEIE